jgi:3-hydroxyacyl-CoA dehydrogenase
VSGSINKVCVIGAGVMGAGIAAHVANAGVDVVLLDIVPEGATNRNTITESAIKKLLKADPAPLMHKRNVKRITPGNIEDDMALLSQCDWIIEAVIERLDIKQDLYRTIDASRKPGSIVSSNTSTIPLANLTNEMRKEFCQNFLIAHFFNPPRYMRLLELVGGKETGADALASVRKFCDVKLGKGVVDCKDTPGFIGNRIGIYWLQCAVLDAIKNKVSVEVADAVMARPMGIPKTGVFGLLDLIGLDLMPHILDSMSETLAEGDAFQDVYVKTEVLEKMIADGYTGRKGKGGFYRLNKDAGGRVKESVDLATGDYATSEKPDLDSVNVSEKDGLRALVEHDDEGGTYAWRVLSKTLSYTASLVPEIADDICAVDEAMRLGYNWKFGPFELIDQLGAAWFADKLKAEGRNVPALLETARDKPFYRVQGGKRQYLTTDGNYADIKRPDGVVMLSDIKLNSEPISSNKSASLWDIGDGVLCLEFHGKMNSLDFKALAMIRDAVARIPRDGYKALVIYNEGSNFSVGANIGLLLIFAKIWMWFLIGIIIRKGQDSYKALKFAPFPVVGAPSGMALGGGCEVLLHCDAVQAHAETYTGLVEVGVGIIPGWGGCKEMLIRWFGNKKRAGGPMPPVIKAFETISTATISKSADEAKSLLYFKDNTRITMNRDRLLADAKAYALELVADYTPPEPIEISLPGPTAKTAMDMAVDGFHKSGKATDHDVVVSGVLAEVLSGGDTDVTEVLTEEDLLALEREGFMKLAKHSDSIKRVQHMLKTGRPLRN